MWRKIWILHNTPVRCAISPFRPARTSSFVRNAALPITGNVMNKTATASIRTSMRKTSLLRDYKKKKRNLPSRNALRIFRRSSVRSAFTATPATLNSVSAAERT